MKKSYYIIVSFLVLIVVSVIGIYLFNRSLAVSDNSNERIIGEVERLEDYAKDYISAGNSSLDSTTLTLEYLRLLRYNDTKWNTLLGSPDTKFIEYVNSRGGVDINPDDYLIDEITYKKIDFIHMIAVLDCYKKHGDSLKYNGLFTISTDYAGWAGDLLTFMGDIYKYRTTNSISDKNTLINYANSLIGTNKSSSFTSEDMYGDLDAINLYKSTDLDLNDLAVSLRKYYVTGESLFNYKNRVESSRNSIGNDADSIKKKATDLLKNTTVQTFLVRDLVGVVTDLDYEVVSTSFANYMLEKPYLEITSTSGKATVGDEDIKVQLYESNLGIPKIELSREICEVEILDDVLYIRPTNAGVVDITISSFNNQASVKYTLTSSNVAPSITKQLDDEYNLSSGIDTTISIGANGTNNTYTWYVGTSKDGDFTRIGVTAGPSFTFKPELDMNLKYLKCIVSNDGNDSVTTNVALLKVKNVSLGDIVNTGDMSLKVGISIIFLVICSNIFVYTVRKYRYDLFD